jgi:hypothetical protein
MVWAVVLWFHHGLSDHQPESATTPGAGDEDGHPTSRLAGTGLGVVREPV